MSGVGGSVDDKPIPEIIEGLRSLLGAIDGGRIEATDAQRAMASCKYHKPDWVRLVRILRETHDQANGNDLDPKTHPEYGQLFRNEQQWLHALVVDPIEWSDHSKILGGGQHRLCALRAAGIEACPVRGEFLAETDYGTPMDASDHARNAITASWKIYASKHGWPAWTGVLASKLPRSIRTRLIVNENT